MWTVTFATEGPPAGHIRRDRTGSPVLDRPLTDGIQAQAGYGLGTE
jgi:hypothetical protein